MFQTHAYDAWTRKPYRQGWWWEFARMQLGGFPARMFLLLAGVSLMLRYASDARKGVSDADSRLGALKRGFEVLLYGLCYRLGAFILGGASPAAARGLFKVDILNCIGVSLMLSSLIVGPKTLKRGFPPILASLLIPLLVFLTPKLQALAYPFWLPHQLGAYLWDANPMGSFPLFPWLAYTLTGCIVGQLWIRASERGRLGQAMALLALLGATMAIGGQVFTRLGYYIYAPTPAVPVPAFPVLYIYRTGMCLVGAALAYLYCQRYTPRFSPLRLLGQASMLVYIVHLELTYGLISWPIRERMHPIVATLMVILLTLLMIGLAYYRIEIFGRKKNSKPVSLPVPTT